MSVVQTTDFWIDVFSFVNITVASLTISAHFVFHSVNHGFFLTTALLSLQSHIKVIDI